MKNLLLIVLALFLSVSLSAQHGQGSFLVEGGINFIQSKSKMIDGSRTEQGPKETSFTLSPALGYFVTPNIAVGIGFSYSSDRTDNIEDFLEDGAGNQYDYTEEITASSIAIGPFVRYYLMPFERSGIFLEAAFFYGFGDGSDLLLFDNPVPVGPSETIARYETTQDFTVLTTGITPGLVFYVTPRMALQATFGFLGYSKYNQENFDDFLEETTEDEISEFDITFNSSSLTFGLSFTF